MNVISQNSLRSLDGIYIYINCCLTFCLDTKSNQKVKTAPKKLKISHLYLTRQVMDVILAMKFARRITRLEIYYHSITRLVLIA